MENPGPLEGVRGEGGERVGGGAFYPGMTL